MPINCYKFDPTDDNVRTLILKYNCKYLNNFFKIFVIFDAKRGTTINSKLYVIL